MEIIDVGQITVEPFKLDAIIDLEIKGTLNNHVSLDVYARLKHGQGDTTISNISDAMQVKVKSGFIDENLIFSGVSENIEITHEDEVYYLRLHALSHSALLDVDKKSRSFQDSSMSYREIIDIVTEPFDSIVTYGDERVAQRTVDNIILQYEETVWEFAKRLASHCNAVLIPKMTADTPDFYFGLDDGEVAESITKFNYSVTKDFHAFRRMCRYSELGFTERDAISYLIKTDDFIFNLGEKLSLNGEPLYVSKIDIKLHHDVLTCIYTLSTSNAVTVEKFFNDIIGLTIPGVVMEAIGDTVKVHLEIDELQDKKTAFKFKYASPYTTEGHTGWYCMPEVGDTVQIIFPCENERYAYAQSGIRQNDTPSTNNPGIKYLRTPCGMQVRFNDDEVMISASDDVTFISINRGSGITIETDEDINIKSGKSIKIEAKEDFIVEAKSIQMSSTTGTNTLNMGKEDSPGVALRSQSEGVTISSGGGNPINIISPTGPVSLLSREGLRIQSGNQNVDVIAATEVSLTGRDAVNSSARGSSIIVSNDIDLTGTIINQN